MFHTLKEKATRHSQNSFKLVQKYNTRKPGNLFKFFQKKGTTKFLSISWNKDFRSLQNSFQTLSNTRSNQDLLKFFSKTKHRELLKFIQILANKDTLKPICWKTKHQESLRFVQILSKTKLRARKIFNKFFQTQNTKGSENSLKLLQTKTLDASKSPGIRSNFLKKDIKSPQNSFRVFQKQNTMTIQDLFRFV